MSKITYTVYFQGNLSNISGRRLSLRDAVETLLGEDGYLFKFRRQGGVQTVLISERSQNSYGGHGRLVPTLLSAPTLDKLREKIVGQAWHGAVAVTDSEYDALVASAESEEE
ncbi:hypothetical protein IP70_15590 [alpha proteobacterium AAP38]|nr:hypothetical protein IP70_15590 [alpha proteobacterium AAP38]